MAYKDGTSTLIAVDDLLAVSDPDILTASLDLTARDTGHPVASTSLRRGLLLGLITASDTYKEYDSGAADGTENEEDAVILAHEVIDIHLAQGSSLAVSVYVRGVFKSAAVFVTGGAPTWNDVQRLTLV